MQAHDIMTTNVITVSPDTTVSEVARVLLSRNIGAVPVVDASRRVAGVVSETDLLRRPETGTLKRRSWLSYFDDPSTLAQEYSRLHGTRARDVMHAQVVSVAPGTDLLEAVDLMEKRGVRRVLVMEGEELRGIVCRSDLLRGMLASKESAPASEGDRSIRALLLDELRDQPWRTIPATILSFRTASRASEAKAARPCVQITHRSPSVLKVTISQRKNDRHTGPAHSEEASHVNSNCLA